MKKFGFLIGSILMLLSASASAAIGEPAKLRDEKFSDKSKQSCQLISRSEAVSRARSQANGKVVSVKLRRSGPNSVYLVRVLVGEKRMKNMTIKACR